MAALTIRKLDEEAERRLRIRAARHSRSIEEEARQILLAELRDEGPRTGNLADAIAAIVDPVGGIEIDVPPRGGGRELPSFDSAGDT